MKETDLLHHSNVSVISPSPKIPLDGSKVKAKQIKKSSKRSSRRISVHADTESKNVSVELNDEQKDMAKVKIDFFDRQTFPQEGELLGPISFSKIDSEEGTTTTAPARKTRKQRKPKPSQKVKQETQGSDTDKPFIKPDPAKISSRNSKRQKVRKQLKEEMEDIDHVSFVKDPADMTEVKITKSPLKKKASSKKQASKSDFEDPSHEDFENLYMELVKCYGKPKLQRSGDSASACGRKQTVVDACMAIILSQNTSNTNSRRALAALKEAYPDGASQILQGTPEDLAKVIKAGGLANVKSKRIFSMLEQLKASTGTLSLEHLREMPTEDIKKELGRFKGLGPKSISCILAFTLDREDLAVDTHVHRVSNRLGLVPQGSSREKVYDYLGKSCPAHLKQELHVLLIRHGQRVCKAQSPKCLECSLSDHCPSFQMKMDLVYSKQKATDCKTFDW